MTRLAEMLKNSPYQGYVYAYPHKTAYRRFSESLPLRRLWENENRESLFLYIHLPFCEMRCGFCNLFTQAQPKGGLVGQYLETLEREAEQFQPLAGPLRFSRFAMGGGTPTFLSVRELERVLHVGQQLGVEYHHIPIGVETSPDTAEPEKLALLRQWGITRMSLGVQSFLEDEVAQVARPQKTATLEQALSHLKDAKFPCLNLDLIYGLPGQTEATWLMSLNRALDYQPEELFLYPLYVRPLTSLGKSGRSWDDDRLHLYRMGRDYLLDEGYQQISMRLFRRSKSEDGPKYCCQEDGMAGLGCGARSYTSAVHYSREYAVGATGIRAILNDYLQQSDESFGQASYGFALDAEDQRRRFVLQSVLQATGLDLLAYRNRFGTNVEDDLPEVCELEENGLMKREEQRFVLTKEGLERSDAIGPCLYSSHVRQLMASYELQ